MEKKWWKEQVMYQIYPRSFNDSNGDGIGDIPGITQKLSYLKDLGVDIIWLGPVYDSPNDDNGYDIRDYYQLHDEFGTLEEWQEMLDGLHQRDMKLIMDLVVNHTSDEHKWFQESRKSIDNPYRDYYFWRKGVDGGPPNNWLSFFGGSAWEYDETTDMYYLHLFTKKQPDLNWENPTVRTEINAVLKFWLDKGIDGFRMDVIPLISKRLPFQDAVFSSFPELVEKYFSNGPRVHEYIQGMNSNVLSHYDIMTVGEGPGITTETAMNYIAPERGELHMIFQLEHMFLGAGEKGKYDQIPYSILDLRRILTKWDRAVGEEGWNNIFLDNHDFARIVSRWGNDKEHRVACAKSFCMLLMTMRGTPCIYQGSEIGMTNVRFPSIDDYDDVETLNFYQEFVVEGDMAEETFMKAVYAEGRDNVRTPMQWSAEEHGGFSVGEPWIKLNPNYSSINVQADQADPDGVFNFYKEMLQLRKSLPDLIYADFEDIAPEDPHCFVYLRKYESSSFYILLNLSDHHVERSVDDLESWSMIMNTYSDIEIMDNKLALQPWQSLFLHKID